tara:strand:- start:314 stop:538 length:225 start_codon:yes stop_codon:yes gene_type:complete
MILEFILLGGYGLFVWPAFFFTFFSCTVLYIKTQKELKLQEKLFLEHYENIQVTKVIDFKREKIAKESLHPSSI